jgi:hypothetical protein
MASFCQQCSISIFGNDFYDYAGLSQPEDTANGKYAVVLCEGCGPCQVDYNGKCISIDCAEKHGKRP